MRFAGELAKQYLRLDLFFQTERESKRIKDVLTIRESIWFALWLLLLPLWLPFRLVLDAGCYTALHPKHVVNRSLRLVWRAAIGYSLIFLMSRFLWSIAAIDAWYWIEVVIGIEGVIETLSNRFHLVVTVLKPVSLWIVSLWIIELSISGYRALKKPQNQ